jgi:hypothetical protein
MDWIHLTQDRCRWWALVNTVMNLLVPKTLGISSLDKQMLASQGGLGSVVFVSFSSGLLSKVL